MAAGDLHGSVQARKLEEELTRTELRTELECKSRSELQSLAKMYEIADNLKSGVYGSSTFVDEKNRWREGYPRLCDESRG